MLQTFQNAMTLLDLMGDFMVFNQSRHDYLPKAILEWQRYVRREGRLLKNMRLT